MRFTSTIRQWRGEIFAVGGEFWAFLKRPDLNALEQSRTPWREGVQLFAILCAIMVGVAALLMPLSVLSGVEPSEQMAGAMTAPALEMILLVVILGPLIEEIAFRSWMSGRWRDLAAAGMFIALYFGGRAAARTAGVADQPGVGFALLGLACLAFVIIANLACGARQPRLFVRFFPALFWIGTLIFGVLHFTNYAGAANTALLIFTIPQLIAGAVFGYARIRIGLVAAIILHSAYNAIPVGLAIAGSIIA